MITAESDFVSSGSCSVDNRKPFGKKTSNRQQVRIMPRLSQQKDVDSPVGSQVEEIVDSVVERSDIEQTES